MNVGYKVAQKPSSKNEFPTSEYNTYLHIIRANSCGRNEENTSHTTKEGHSKQPACWLLTMAFFRRDILCYQCVASQLLTWLPIPSCELSPLVSVQVQELSS